MQRRHVHACISAYAVKALPRCLRLAPPCALLAGSVAPSRPPALRSFSCVRFLRVRFGKICVVLKMVFMLGVLVYVVLQFIALLCVLIGNFLDMFRFIPFYRQNHLPCLTLWGYKVDCYSTKYVLSSNQRWASCPARRDRFRGSQALVIISICVYGAAVVFGFLMLFRFAFCRWLCLALNILGVCTLGTTGALVMVAYYIDEGIDCPELRVDFKYGVGFALLMVAWVLDIFNTPILWLPWPTVNSAENVNHSNGTLNCRKGGAKSDERT